MILLECTNIKRIIRDDHKQLYANKFDNLDEMDKFFDVSINTLLGSPQQLVCKCCGMNLEDCNISKETNGNFNEEYCKWCYTDGDFTLDFWKQYIKIGGVEKFEEFKKQIIDEFNTILGIEGLPKIEKLNVLSGSFILVVK